MEICFLVSRIVTGGPNTRIALEVHQSLFGLVNKYRDYANELDNTHEGKWMTPEIEFDEAGQRMSVKPLLFHPQP